MNDFPVIKTNTTAGSIITNYGIPLWKAQWPLYEVHGHVSPINIPQFTYSYINSNNWTNEFFLNNITGINANSSPAVHTISWDNTSQITGTGSLKVTSSVTSGNFTQIWGVVGGLDNRKKYILRFKTKATVGGYMNIFLLRRTGDFAHITPTQLSSLNTSVQQHQFLFSGLTSLETSAAFYIELSQNSGTTFLDDIEFYEAIVNSTNIDSKLLFKANPTNTPMIISFKGMKYTDAKGVDHNNSISIAAFSSFIGIQNGLAP